MRHLRVFGLAVGADSWRKWDGIRLRQLLYERVETANFLQDSMS